ncbi:four-carbon acid sugar kinase family protein [Variovorax sp. HJSM1_2]|uniref:four-carbon acid sugar kinase family protein n=1 Tax=Variovorax sp. HJSM1_2 TaxID=3366263 RepID=UPI003BC89C77
MTQHKGSWRILADDLTGALDSAAMFAGVAPVPVYLAPPDQALEAAASPVQALATGTRDVQHDAMVSALQSSLPWFTTPGHAAFKKVDSLLRGNSFAEVAWLLRHAGFEGVVFAPAYPAQGRFTRGGRHWVGTSQAPSPEASSPSLLEVFALHGVVARLGHDLAAGGQGQVLIPDVNSDADLAALAAQAGQAHAQSWLWCGSAGLAQALSAQTRPGAAPAIQPGLTHVVTASRHPVLRAQLQGLAAAGMHCADLASAEPLSASAAADLLRQRTRQLVATLPRPDNLVVVGGDTLLALCRAAGVQSLLAGAGPRSGWGCARLQGGAWHGVTCYSRSGAFGAPDDLSALLALLAEKEPTT